jgi:hypothetical protein
VLATCSQNITVKAPNNLPQKGNASTDSLCCVIHLSPGSQQEDPGFTTPSPHAAAAANGLPVASQPGRGS